MNGAVVFKAKATHTATVIFCHGLGDTGHGWSQSFESMRLPNVKYIFPHAPSMPVSLNMGMKMPAWYDLFGLSENDKEDADGIKHSAKQIFKLVDDEVASGIPSKKIIIGGFSQGGAISLYAGLTLDKPLGGICALSSYLPLRKEFPENLKNKDVKIFQGHGDADEVVSFKWGKATFDYLQKIKVEPEFHTYSGMGHSSCLQEMKDVHEFIKKQVGE